VALALKDLTGRDSAAIEAKFIEVLNKKYTKFIEEPEPAMLPAAVPATGPVVVPASVPAAEPAGKPAIRATAKKAAKSAAKGGE
jgi:hypothetical protein